MKQINVWFEDEEHALIKNVKDKHARNWHDFLLEAAKELNKEEMAMDISRYRAAVDELIDYVTDGLSEEDPGLMKILARIDSFEHSHA